MYTAIDYGITYTWYNLHVGITYTWYNLHVGITYAIDYGIT